MYCQDLVSSINNLKVSLECQLQKFCNKSFVSLINYLMISCILLNFFMSQSQYQ